MDLDPARLVLEALEREGVQYAVFGAVALGIHGLARATEDLGAAPPTLRTGRRVVPVRRFRSVGEMKGPHWYQPGDPALYLAIRRVWALHARTVQPRFPPGVYRHRSLEEMTALQEQWDAANFARHRERMEEVASAVEGDGPPEAPV